MNTTDIFADSVINIALVKGMVRIEMGSHSASETTPGGKPAVLSRYQLVLTPQAFYEMSVNMERMQKLLLEKGVIRPKDGEERRSGPARTEESIG
ncbi:MAG: hypothetical protein ACYYKD_13040 [Rhodospirillales bacterium]